VLGLADAESAEHGVPSSNLLITPVACPMPDRAAGAPKLSGAARIHLRPGTRAAEIYGCEEIAEHYFCNYEVNPEYREPLEASGLVLSGFSEDGAVRIAELPDRPFFVATLFQPQLSVEAGNPHPLITAFVRACSGVPRPPSAPA
jgi:CTP synthase (UTP-ammonia lyase)